MKTYAFIDASNLFYGGEKSLGWKIDYRKLLKYIKKQYGVSKAYYYGGVELYGFVYSPLDNKPIDILGLLQHLTNKTKENEYFLKQVNRVKFYLKLKEFGYRLVLKPVKTYKQGKKITKKANCDVDMTFDMMRYLSEYGDALVMTGDGDFLPVIQHLRKVGKKVTILARGERTAKEIRQFAGGDFRDFVRLEGELRYEKDKKRSGHTKYPLHV